MNRLRILIASVLCVTACTISANEYTAIYAGKLIDVEASKELSNQAILIKGEQIVALGDRRKINIPDDARILDLGAYTVLPGLIDAHAHINQSWQDHGYAVFTRSEGGDAIQGVINASTMLQQGFTSARVPGTLSFADVALRDAINAGKVPGPRLKVAGPYVGVTGGCNDENVKLSALFRVEMSGRVNGVDEARRVVREHALRKVDQIKTCTTGSVLSMSGGLNETQWSMDELEALVDEAHRHNMPVLAHAHGTAGIKKAILAGVDSIEHASVLDNETIRLAIKHGTALVMDIYWTDWIQAEGLKNGMAAESLQRDRDIGQTQRDGFRKAHKAGANIVFGTDVGGFPFTENSKQFATMVEYGMSEMAVLRSATIKAAALMRMDAMTGSLKVGKYADIVAVRNNPLDDISELERVQFVMKNGEIVRQ
ncbi:MAG: amidohydrolase family protein [Pseudomonadales bacterium]